MTSCPPQHPASGCHSGRICGLFFTSFLTGGSALLYYVDFVIPTLQDGFKGSSAKTILGFVSLFLSLPLFVLMFITFYRVCFTNPGSAPQLYSAANVERLVVKVINNRRQLRGEAPLAGPLSRMAMQAVLTVSLCDRCGVYKLGDVHHCSTCGQCIVRMDHHCPWVGQCVGRDNHKYFAQFLGYTSLSGIVFCATSVATLFPHGIEKGVPPDRVLFLLAWIIAALFALLLFPFMLSVVNSASEGVTKLAKLRRRRAEFQRKLDRARAEREHLLNTAKTPVTPSDGATKITFTPLEVEADAAANDGEDPQKALSDVFGEEGYRSWRGKIWWFCPTTPVFSEVDEATVEREIEVALNINAADSLTVTQNMKQNSSNAGSNATKVDLRGYAAPQRPVPSQYGDVFSAQVVQL